MSAATAHEAKTVHRLLEVEYRSEDANTSVFQRNEHNLLEEDILIIDEVSMMDMFLFEALLSAVRPARGWFCLRQRSASERGGGKCAPGFD